MRNYGLRALTWLLKIQTDPQGGHLSLIGNNGWLKRGGKQARFDQQPIDAAGLVDASFEAYRVTQDESWLKSMEQCFDWFLGRNDVHTTLVELATGGCRDGLRAGGVNQNQGAESTISWLMALHRVHQIVQERPSEA